MRTLRIKQLVDEVLDTLPKPHTEDVIDDAFHAIEQNPLWRKTYDDIVYQLGKPVANACLAFWVAHAKGLVGEIPGPAARSSLIQSYSKLVTPEAKRSKKVKEAEALKAMHDHFQANRESLPATIREQRDLIVTLIMSGIPTETAFSKAIERPMYAR